MVDAIDERTLLVPLSHVLFRSAYIQDVRAIIEKAHSSGRSSFSTPTSRSYGARGRESSGCRCLARGVLKCCAGPGGAFLYVRPSLPGLGTAPHRMARSPPSL